VRNSVAQRERTEPSDSAKVSRRELIRGGAVSGLALTAGSIALSACGSSSSASGASSATKAATTAAAKKVVFSFPGESLDIYPLLLHGAQQEAQSAGYQLLTSHATTQQGQVTEVDTWLAEGVAAITILPVDPTAAGPLVAKAHQQGTKFCAYASTVPGMDCQLGIGNVQGGHLVGAAVAEFINKSLGGKAKVALYLNPQSIDTVQRVQAAAQKMKALAPGAEIVATENGALGTGTLGLQLTQSLLQRVPDLNVVIPLNDTLGLGAAQAFKDAGRNLDKVYTTGFDGSRAALEAIKAGGSALKSTAGADLVAVGAAAVKIAIDAAEHKSPTTIVAQYELVSAQTPQLLNHLLGEYTAH
jgi:ABC-type sugar transport system substrate-binding protein